MTTTARHRTPETPLGLDDLPPAPRHAHRQAPLRPTARGRFVADATTSALALVLGGAVLLGIGLLGAPTTPAEPAEAAIAGTAR